MERPRAGAVRPARDYRLISAISAAAGLYAWIEDHADADGAGVVCLRDLVPVLGKSYGALKAARARLAEEDLRAATFEDAPDGRGFAYRLTRSPQPPTGCRMLSLPPPMARILALGPWWLRARILALTQLRARMLAPPVALPPTFNHLLL